MLRHRPGDLLSDAAVRNYTGFTRLRVQTAAVPGWWTGARDLIVPCETAAEILAKFPAVRETCRLCSVRGGEKEALEGIDWSTFHPEVFVVGFRAYDPVKLGEDISAEWIGILEGQGYSEVARTDRNIVLQRE